MNVTFHDLTTLEKTKEWDMVPKAQREFSRICRKLPFRVKINDVYLLDGKKSSAKIKDDRIRSRMLRGAVAMYDQHTDSLYLDVYMIIGDEGDVIHELAHAYDYQHKMISMRRTFVEAFLRDKGQWHENVLISGKRAEKPYEFFADFVATYLLDKQHAKERFPNYYQTFKRELKL